MSRRIVHREYLVEWAEGRGSGSGRFIADGPFDWDAWDRIRPRVLFLLKEAYDADGVIGRWLDADFRGTSLAERWTLPSVVKGAFVFGEGVQLPRTWQNLYVWAKAMQEFDAACPPGWAVPQDPEGVWEVLRRSAFVNLKKYDGMSKSSHADLVSHLQEQPLASGASNVERLRQQFELLAPDLVICCGSYAPLLESAGGDADWLPGDLGEWGIGEASGAMWFDYWHPAWHSVPRYLLVQGLYAMRVQWEAQSRG